MLNTRDVNIVVLGLSFMFIFTAFQTTSMIEQSILKSAKNEASDPGSFKSSGYNSLCIIYASFALFNWIAPSIISVIGPKYSMFLGGICYWIFIGSLYFVSRFVNAELSGLLYAVSVVLGFGAAVIWTAQGNCLTINSTTTTIGRNSGIFWVFLQSSLLIGSLIVYFCFKPKSGPVKINLHQRSTVLIVFFVLAVFGSFFVLLIRKNINTQTADNEEMERDSRTDHQDSPLGSFISSVKLFFTKDMFLLNICFVYTGLELTFFSGVYSTCVGNTLSFAASKRLIGVSGMFIGLGEILGGGLFGIFGKHITKNGRDSVVFLGMIMHFICFFLILINLPEQSPNKETHDMGYLFKPSIPLAMFCSFLLGFGDSCYNTQIFSFLGDVYSTNSAPAFAIFKFSQSVAAAVGFFYSTYLGLKIQLIILIVMAFFGTLSYFVVERNVRQRSPLQISE